MVTITNLQGGIGVVGLSVWPVRCRGLGGMKYRLAVTGHQIDLRRAYFPTMQTGVNHLPMKPPDVGVQHTKMLEIDLSFGKHGPNAFLQIVGVGHRVEVLDNDLGLGTTVADSAQGHV